MADIAAMGMQEKLGIVLRRAGPLLPGDAGRRLLALVSPKALAIMAGVIAVWAASHFAGVGEIADVAMLIGGWLTIGTSALSGCRKLLAFGLITHSARTEADLDRAARDFADGVSILGVDVALGLLFQARPRGTFRTYSKAGIDQPPYAAFARTMPRTGPLRRLEYKLIFTKQKWAGEGGTRPNNLARIGRDWVPGAKTRAEAVRQIHKAIHHEHGHQWVNRNLSAFGRPALWLKLGAYKRSYLLRYAEEFIAEFNAQRRMGRIGDEPLAYRFPVNARYEITFAKLGEETVGILLGPVTIGGAVYQVYYGPNHADH